MQVVRYMSPLVQNILSDESQSVDLGQTLTFYKIRKEKDERILRKLYFQKLERKRRILI